MRFNKYFFGDPPGGHKIRTLISDENTDKLVSDIICAGQDTYILSDFDDKNRILICELTDIGMCSIDRYFHISIASPVFIRKDLQVLKKLTEEYSQRIAESIIHKQKEFEETIKECDMRYSKAEHLYHLLCGAVFDGCFFDRLGDTGVITISKPQKNGQDYLPVLYEDDDELNAFSAKLLCSYNRATGNAGTFSSFGDADGDRHDIFRWYRRRINGDTGFSESLDRLYNMYGSANILSALAEMFSEAVNCKEIGKEWKDAFEWAGYMKNGRICVPIYRKDIKNKAIQRLVEHACEIIFDDICGILCDIATEKQLTAAKLGIPAADIANEVYHLLFGQINEVLVREGFAACPRHYNDQGRYLQCFEMK
ncbi:MAG: hypothetical protein IJC56_01270 [Clostridia bacterium]|nr:hypothetical protein [Clostridia bacterium]